MEGRCHVPHVFEMITGIEGPDLVGERPRHDSGADRLLTVRVFDVLDEVCPHSTHVIGKMCSALRSEIVPQMIGAGHADGRCEHR